VVSGSTGIEDVLKLAPEWEQLLRNFRAESNLTAASEFLNRIGAKAIFMKALSLQADREQRVFIEMLQTAYYQPMLAKMLGANQNLRRFLTQRHVANDEQKANVLSFSMELSQKLLGTLIKQLQSGADDGFKVLLPAYVQRSVHNAVIDYIRQEANWEKQTLQDLNLDPQQDDPRSSVADDVAYTPEHKALSGEQVTQLNELRRHLAKMLKDNQYPSEPLVVVDCIFGLGLTPQSTSGEEMTMRECCDKLNINAETQARRIARCQVLLDKGLDLIRQKIYKDMPGIADAWQRGLNVNTASRRELSQQLGMTEGEVERAIKGRQFHSLKELVERAVIKEQRLSELTKKGAVAAFVPVDINAATNRDIMDILGVEKETAAKIVSERPFKDMDELVAKKLATKDELAQYCKRGAVARNKHADSKRIDLNHACQEDIEKVGIDPATAQVIVKTRPFLTWAEVEEFIGADSPAWSNLRQRFFLGLTSG
jgi:DNA uptake protein ComE-like DNA-binding protein